MEINVSLDVNVYSELMILYQRLEEKLIQLNPGCSGCGICCDFSKLDHVLYASSIEVNFITQHIKVPNFNILDNLCPFLKDNQCSIRNFRMLGCRVFYCDPYYQVVSQDVYEEYHRRIKELSIEYNIIWKYQPFLRQLAKFKSDSPADTY